MEEIWKDISGYEGLYQVSNFGNVKSLKFGKERILKPVLQTNGYFYVGLCKDGKTTMTTIHKLVAIVFHDHIPNGYETVINHIDNNKLNNNVDNLELVSARYNTTCHRKDLGVHLYKTCNKWVAKICIGKNVYLGLFTDKQDALDMYQKALANIDLYNGDNKQFRKILKTN